MKKEMMLLIDTFSNFESVFNSKEYQNQKDSSVSQYPDVDEYDLGYANGYNASITNAAKSCGDYEDFVSELDGVSRPIDIVTENSQYKSTSEDEEDDSEFDEDNDDFDDMNEED